MKITFCGNFNVDYSSESHHARSLEALGHTVIRMQEGKVDGQAILASASNSDMLVFIHTHGWQTPGLALPIVLQKLKEHGIPTVTYHLDLWLGLKRQQDLSHDDFYKHIEYFFTVDKLMADWFNDKTEVKGRYLRAGVFADEVYDKPQAVKTNDIIFVGSRGYHPEWRYRPELIDWLKTLYTDRFRHIGGDGEGVVRGHELNRLYQQTKVAVGDSLCIGFTYPYYWSDRLYETIGRGGFTIFPYIEGLEEEFEVLPDYSRGEDNEGDNIELVTYEYGNFDQLKHKIDYYLEHDDEREAIRQRGFNRVKNNYTYEHRWRTIINEVTNNG